MLSFPIVFLVLIAFSTFLFIIFSFTNYKVRFLQSYDLRNHFPYELNYESKFKDNLMGNVFAVLLLVSTILFYVFFDTDHKNGFFIFTMIAGIVNACITFGLIFVPLKFLKSHLALVTANIVFSFLVPFSLAMYASIRYNTTKDISGIVFAILNAIICLFVFVLVINPKLTKWAEMDKKENEDGTTTYVRPRIFVLAFTEWLLLFTNVLTALMAILTKVMVS